MEIDLAQFAAYKVKPEGRVPTSPMERDFEAGATDEELKERYSLTESDIFALRNYPYLPISAD